MEKLLEKQLDLLLSSDLFSGMNRQELPGLLHCLSVRRMEAGKSALLLREGEPAHEMGLLLSGSAQVFTTDYEGNRSILSAIRPGQLFGEAFACAGVERLPISVMATEDCQALMLDIRRVMTVCDQACPFHQQLIFRLMNIMAHKNLAMLQKVMITSRRSTREKLMAYLQLQAKQQGGRRFTIHFDRQQLADYLEVDRSGLSAELSKMKKEGLIDYYRSNFYLREHFQEKE